jgi:hypothetical protein
MTKMKAPILIILFFIALLTITNCKKGNIANEPEPEPIINHSPQSPDIELIKISYNTAIINCKKAIDLDGDKVYYSLLLEDSLLISNSKVELFYKFENLKQETTYHGIVRVSDSINPAVDTHFTFTTEKYITRFSHTLTSTLGETGAGMSIEITDDGGYIILGTISYLTNYWYVVKVDSLGYEQWSKFYDIKISDFASCEIIKVSNGNYVFAAQKHIVMIDQNGEILWHVIKEEFSGYNSIIENNNHELIVVGDNSKMISILCLNLSGEEIWTKQYQSINERNARSLCKTHDNNFMIFGVKRGDKNDFWIMKIGQNGEVLWEKIFESPDYAFAGQIILCKDNGFVLVGQTNDNLGTPTSRIIKTDMSGNLMWDKSFIWHFYGTQARSIVQNQDESYIFSADNGYETVLAKLDQSGNLLWKNHFKPDLLMDYIWRTSEMKLCADNGVIVTGVKTWVWNGSENQEKGIWVFKTDKDGFYSIE